LCLQNNRRASHAEDDAFIDDDGVERGPLRGEEGEGEEADRIARMPQVRPGPRGVPEALSGPHPHPLWENGSALLHVTPGTCHLSLCGLGMGHCMGWACVTVWAGHVSLCEL